MSVENAVNQAATGDVLGYASKRVVVTGCASGIGRAVASLLGRLGARIHGFDRHEGADDLAAFTLLDLADPASIDRACATVHEPIDILFNCAGLAPTQPALAVIKVNFLGTRHFTERLIDRMGEGSAIVNVSSNGGLRWREHYAAVRGLLETSDFESGLRWLDARLDDIPNAYSFTKEALTAWTLRESAKLIARGIRINCTSPGAVRTPMLDEIEAVVPSAHIDTVARPIGRRSSADEQAWPLVMLGSPRSSYVNGVDLAVDGGFAATFALDGAAG